MPFISSLPLNSKFSIRGLLGHRTGHGKLLSFAVGMMLNLVSRGHQRDHCGRKWPLFLEASILPFFFFFWLLQPGHQWHGGGYPMVLIPIKLQWHPTIVSSICPFLPTSYDPPAPTGGLQLPAWERGRGISCQPQSCNLDQINLRQFSKLIYILHVARTTPSSVRPEFQ